MKNVIIIGAGGTYGTSTTIAQRIIEAREQGIEVVEYKPNSEQSKILELADQLNSLTERENKAMREAEPFILQSIPHDEIPFYPNKKIKGYQQPYKFHK